MSFFKKNKIKLFFALFFVLISIFGSVNNVNAQLTGILDQNLETTNDVEVLQKAIDDRSAILAKGNLTQEERIKIYTELTELDARRLKIENATEADRVYRATVGKEGTSEGENIERQLTKIQNELDTEKCDVGYTGLGILSFACLRYGLAYILGWILWVLSAVTYVVAEIFTYTVDFSINSISGYATMPAVLETWKILRDIVNMFALLIMMYIAIGTILQLDGVNWKKMIGNMIIAVILVNFSMAITGVVIDTTNVFAVYFYEKAKGGPNGNLSTILVDKLNIAEQLAKGQTAATSLGNVSTTNESAVPSVGSIIVNSLGTLIFMIAFIFVMFTASALFIIRIVSLIFALIFSPLPWIAMIIPKYGSKIDTGYWANLMNQAIFAPVFMFCLYITMKVIACGELIETANAGANLPIIGGVTNTIFFHVLIIGFLMGSLTAAKSMGAAGASAAGKIAGGLTAGTLGLIGRETLGRMSESYKKTDSYVLDREKGGMRSKLADTLGASSFDFRSIKSIKEASGIDMGSTGSGMIYGEGFGGGAKGFAGKLKDDATKKKEDDANIKAAKQVKDRDDLIQKYATLSDNQIKDLVNGLNEENAVKLAEALEKNTIMTVSDKQKIMQWTSSKQRTAIKDSGSVGKPTTKMYDNAMFDNGKRNKDGFKYVSSSVGIDRINTGLSQNNQTAIKDTLIKMGRSVKEIETDQIMKPEIYMNFDTIHLGSLMDTGLDDDQLSEIKEKLQDAAINDPSDIRLKRVNKFLNSNNNWKER